MCILPAWRRLVSACTVFFGPHGAVQALAHQRGASRQSLYREADAALAAADGSAHRAAVEELRRQLAQRAAQCAALEQRLAGAVELSADRIAEFASTAQAIGVSLPQARRLLQVLHGQHTPSVAQLGRATARAARQATALLTCLDAVVRPRLTEAAADEIYAGRKPILMVVEPHSRYWASGRLVPRLHGQEWHQEFAAYPALAYVTSDAGTALGRGLGLVRRDRLHSGRPDIRHGLDVFHTLREGNRALRRDWRRAARALDHADRQQQQRLRLGQSRAGQQTRARKAWQRAEAAFDEAWARDRAWQQAQQALAVYRPDGRVADRTWAEAQLAEALPRLAGAHWDKARRLLQAERHRGVGRRVGPPRWRCRRGRLERRGPEPPRRRPRPAWQRGADPLAFLDRLQEQLAALGLRPETLRAHLDLEGWRRRPRGVAEVGPQAAAARGLELVRRVQLCHSEPDWEAQAAAVRAVLRRVVRASSAVEGVNSVLRVQQSRHRRLTQGLLDLKRLYWNGHPFRTGRHKGHSPCDLVGVRLPPGGWWRLLQLPPEQLQQYLSAQQVTV